MPTSRASKNFPSARETLKHPLTFEQLLEKLPPKDRVNAERRVAALQALPEKGLAELWQRIASAMMTLAPVAKFVGKQTVQFYIPDGKYRMQVFALEDLQDGKMTIYCPDVLEETIKGGLLSHAAGAEPSEHTITATKEPLLIDQLDKNSINAGAHFKDLIGWNRKAVRISLPPSASPTQVETAELFCAIAAQHFVRPAAAEAPAKKA